MVARAPMKGVEIISGHKARFRASAAAPYKHWTARRTPLRRLRTVPVWNHDLGLDIGIVFNHDA